MVQKILIAVFSVAGLVVMGLVTYSFFFLGQENAALDLNQLILINNRSIFMDKTVEADFEIVKPYPGYMAPDFALSDLLGNQVRLSDYRGQPVLLNFWATWCPPCRQEMPELQAFHDNYGEQIKIIGIDWAEEVQTVKAFLDDFGITYTNLLDRNGEAFVLYQLTGLPTSFWIDEQGIVRGIWLGAMKSEDIVMGFRKTTSVFEDSL